MLICSFAWYILRIEIILVNCLNVHDMDHS